MYDFSQISILNICIFSWLLPFINTVIYEIKNQIYKNLYKCIEIKADSEFYNKVKFFISKNALVKHKAILSGSNRIYDNFIENKYDLNLAIPTGIYYITLRNTLYTLNYSVNDITVSCFAWKNFNILFDIINDAKIDYDKRFVNKIALYNRDITNVWSFSKYLEPRYWNTVVLPNDTKKLIENEIDRFDKRKDFYAGLGIPYKKTILLNGLPGTGKSSLAVALALKYQRNLYVVDITSDNVWNMIPKIPDKSLILIEDIDRNFIALRDKDNKDIITGWEPTFNLSKLLNTLDGVMVNSDCITLMTTNNIEILPEALIRPGRIDLVVHFGYCTKEQVETYLGVFYGKNIITDDMIKKFTTMLFDGCLPGSDTKIPVIPFTLARFQAYLLKYEDSSEDAYANLRTEFIEASKEKLI